MSSGLSLQNFCPSLSRLQVSPWEDQESTTLAGLLGHTSSSGYELESVSGP